MNSCPTTSLDQALKLLVSMAAFSASSLRPEHVTNRTRPKNATENRQRCPFGYFSFTSNIDSHWITSGMSAERVLEVHGAVRWLQCSKPCCPDVWKAPNDLALTESPATHRVEGVLPCCPKCKAVARPNVQMFGGDSGFSRARRGAQNSRSSDWARQVS
eukprot:s90_g49.t1